jgi:hypothetical protein
VLLSASRLPVLAMVPAWPFMAVPRDKQSQSSRSPCPCTWAKPSLGGAACGAVLSRLSLFARDVGVPSCFPCVSAKPWRCRMHKSAFTAVLWAKSSPLERRGLSRCPRTCAWAKLRWCGMWWCARVTLWIVWGQSCVHRLSQASATWRA